MVILNRDGKHKIFIAFIITLVFTILYCTQAIYSQELIIDSEYTGPNPITGISTVRVVEGGSVSLGYEVFADVIVDGGFWEGSNGHGDFILEDGLVGNISSTFTSISIKNGTVAETISTNSSIQVEGGELFGGVEGGSGIEISKTAEIHGHVLSTGIDPESSLIISGGIIHGEVGLLQGTSLIVRDSPSIKGDIVILGGGAAHISGGILEGQIVDSVGYSGSKRIFISAERGNFSEVAEDTGLITGIFVNGEVIGGYDGLHFSGNSELIDFQPNVAVEQPVIIINSEYSGHSEFDYDNIYLIEVFENGIINQPVWVNSQSFKVYGGVIQSVSFDGGLITIFDGSVGYIGTTDEIHVVVEGGVVERIEGAPRLFLRGGEVLNSISSEYWIRISGTALINGDVLKQFMSGGGIEMSGGIVTGDLILEGDYDNHLEMTGGEIFGDLRLDEGGDDVGFMSGGMIHGSIVVDKPFNQFSIIANTARLIPTGVGQGVIYGRFNNGAYIGGEDGLPYFGPPEILKLETTEEWSDPLFIRSDVNQDGRTNIADVYSTLDYLFNGVDLICEAAADFDKNMNLDITDVIQSILFIFKSGLPPEGAYPFCEPVSSDTTISCESDFECTGW